MTFVGRRRELGSLRGHFDAGTPSLTSIGGPAGSGKSALLERVAADYQSAYAICPPLPEAEQRAAVGARIALLREAAGLPSAPPQDWNALIGGVVDCVEPHGAPMLLCLDDAGRLKESRARYLEAIASALRRAAEEARALHIVLIGHTRVQASELVEVSSIHHLEVGGLPLRSARELLPGSSVRDAVRAFSIFGGLPGVLARLDTSASLATNVRTHLLGRESALCDLPASWIERTIQNPTRYFAILAALCQGEASWASVHAGVSDLSSSGQVAPYLRKLQEMGIVEVRRSLDASPSGRNRRYCISDPFLSFWFRFVLPYRLDAGRPDAGDWYTHYIRPNLDDHAAVVFPSIARRFMGEDAMEVLGSNARELGSLWGEAHEIPVAGLLASGAAFYGHARWNGYTRDDRSIATLDEQIRETRFGFGRQHRLRLLFTGRPAPRSMQREVARREDVFLVGIETILGDE